MLAIGTGEDGGQTVSVSRMSFNETPNWRDAIGFLNRLSFTFEPLANVLTVSKGGLVYGFKHENNPTHGYVVDSDMSFPVITPNENAIFYVTMSVDGILRVRLGNYADVRGIGANITGIPWYTFNGDALVGKVFKSHGFITGWVVCDDPFWCEFEGVF